MHMHKRRYTEQSEGMKTKMRMCWREFLHFKFNNNNTILGLGYFDERMNE